MPSDIWVGNPRGGNSRKVRWKNPEPSPPVSTVYLTSASRNLVNTKLLEFGGNPKNPNPLELLQKPRADPRRISSYQKLDSAAKRRKSKERAQSERLPKTKLAREIIENHAKFPHCILLTRVGQFYESYFDQAPEVAKLLNIKLAQRRWGVRGRIVNMAGFPLIHLDRHLKTLVQTEKRFVALCEEFRKPGAPPGPKKKYGPSPFERRVVRIVTPGTLIDESNRMDGRCYGEFFTQLSNSTQLRDDLARINPREIVLDKFLEGPENVDHPIHGALGDSTISVAYCDAAKELDATSLEMRTPPVIVDNITNVTVLDAAAELDLEDMPTTPVFSPAETLAIRLISAFLQANLRESMPKLTTPVRFQEDARMHIDAHTVRALEIQKGSQGESSVGSLLSVVKRTVTSSGSRLLSRWLCGPSTSVQEIRARQALVALFYARPHLRRDIVALLRKMGDATRLVQKLILGRGDADDLLAIAETIGVTLIPLHAFRRVSDLSQLAEKIGTAVHVTPLLLGETEAPPKVTPAVGLPESSGDYVESKNWSIKPDFNPELKKLHKRLKKLKDQQEEMQWGFNWSMGFLMEYSSTLLKLEHMELNCGITNCLFLCRKAEALRAISTSPGVNFGTEITECQAAILQAERNALESLRAEVASCAVALRRNARIIDEIDVTVGFAELAAQMNFVRPVVNDSLNFLTVNARHPAVEIGLLNSGRVFTPNTSICTHIPSSKLTYHATIPPAPPILSDLNIGRKIHRPTAICTYRNSRSDWFFCTADHAEIGVVDRVFSRIGARDDLFRDRSTFMVEMLEAGEILRRATERSLVIMDEVGRGTTVRDGLAIAFATAHHLHSKNRCRAMFATHFHEVADMLGYYETRTDSAVQPPGNPNMQSLESVITPHCARPHISFFCTDITSTGDSITDEFTYSHRLQPGVNRESHGLRVAQLGGMPSSAVEVARRVMERLRDNGPTQIASSDRQSVLQVGLGLGLGNRDAMRKIGEDF
ncbi:MutS domain I [Rhizoctonia solani]|uniref:MutS domain I n=1 Tax=Rhizoctonia solani TaxID=456999 RepID=A0A8H7IKY2_9AGAM|nr:MutS domain I [Rhizoctonia solani]